MPVITILGLSVPSLIGGSVIIESIFALPGLGQLFYQAVMARDYPLIMGSVSCSAPSSRSIGNLLADVGYGLADPRIRIGQGRANDETQDHSNESPPGRDTRLLVIWASSLSAFMSLRVPSLRHWFAPFDPNSIHVDSSAPAALYHPSHGHGLRSDAMYSRASCIGGTRVALGWIRGRGYRHLNRLWSSVWWQATSAASWTKSSCVAWT